MTIRIYVSVDPTIPFGESWESVGTLESSTPSINTKAAKKLQSISGGGGVRISFYLSGDPLCRWVGAKAEHSNFGIAFDLLGDGSRILVAERAAKVTPVTAREPEPHPGMLTCPVFLPISLSGHLRRV